MATQHQVRIQESDFDLTTEVNELRKSGYGAGAIVTFCGLVRDNNLDAGVAGLFLEHYPGMTEKSISAMLDEASSRWDLIGASVIHRVGLLHPGEQIVFVGTASPHRADAFAAADFIMDYLKTRAPFWKKEQTDAGSRWLSTRETDVEAAERWKV